VAMDLIGRPKNLPDVYDAKTDNPCKIYVSALPMETSNDGLRRYFEQFGEVVDAVVMKNWMTGYSRRFGFVTFKYVDSVEAVLRSTHVLEGKTVEVSKAVVKGLVHMRFPKIYVAALPLEVSQEELRAYFSQFGPVEKAQIILSHETGQSRGFGFVTFHDIETAKTVIQMEHTLRDRKVVLKAAEPKGFETSRYSRSMMYSGYQVPQAPMPVYDGYGYPAQSYPAQYYGGQQQQPPQQQPPQQQPRYHPYQR